MEEVFSHSLMVMFKLYTYKNILLVFCQGQMIQLQKKRFTFCLLKKKSVYSNSANTVRFYFSELNYYTLSDRGVFQAPFLGVFIHFGWNKVSKTKGQVACGSEGLISVPKNSPGGFPSAYRHCSEFQTPNTLKITSVTNEKKVVITSKSPQTLYESRPGC